MTVVRVRAPICPWLAGLFAAALLTAGSAGALTIDSIQIDHGASAALGGGPIGGTGCLPSGPCSGSSTDTGVVSTAIPLGPTLIEDYSTAGGTNSVKAFATARLQIALPTAFEISFHGADTVFTGFILAVASIRDSEAASFHTSAAASVQVDDRIVFTVPLLGPGDSFSIRTRLLGFQDSFFTTQYGGSFRISRVSDDLTLFTTSGPTLLWEELDLSAQAGEAIALDFTAAISMAGGEGFGGGADRLTARGFSSSLRAAFAIRHLVVPEPGTLGLLLVALGLYRIRDHLDGRHDLEP